MMGIQSEQIQRVILDIDSMIPENHLLRQIKDRVNFDSIYEKAASYDSNTGRRSIDPVILIKMLLIGYLYGIKSERRLEDEGSLNLAYRWFCGINLMHRVPDHSPSARTENDVLRILVYSGRYSMKLCGNVSSLELYLEKQVLRIVRFFRPTYLGTAAMKQLRQLTSLL